MIHLNLHHCHQLQSQILLLLTVITWLKTLKCSFAQIRMQAEYQAGTNVIRKGMINSFVSMFKEEGLRGLYRVIF